MDPNVDYFQTSLAPEPPPHPSLEQPSPQDEPATPSEPAKLDKRPSREALRQAREAEAAGVPFLLKEPPEVEVMIKPFTLADRSLWMGVPTTLQSLVSEAYDAAQKQGIRRATDRTFAQVMEDVARDEKMANAVCMAVFVSPRLVATEEELAGDPDAWVVTDVHINDRIRVMQWVSGNRAEEDLERVAAFRRRRAGMAAAPAGRDG